MLTQLWQLPAAVLWILFLAFVLWKISQVWTRRADLQHRRKMQDLSAQPKLYVQHKTEHMNELTLPPNQ